MSTTNHETLESFWTTLLEQDGTSVGALIAENAAFDDPLFGGASGTDVRAVALPRLATWIRERIASTARPVRHLRTVADERRVAVESVIEMKNGLVWNQAKQVSEKAERFQLAVAVVGDRAERDGAARLSAVRIYFGTWSVLDGAPKMRIGPVSPDERDATARALRGVPALDRYFDCLARGDSAIRECFEVDGYFREPANNYACGTAQLDEHFAHVMHLGGVGLEWRTAVRSGSTIVLEGQTVTWGTKRMPAPQAGYASYDVGVHGLIAAGRVYDSVVPP